MKEVGFERYGVDKHYPSSITTSDYYNSTQYKQMIENYKKILNYDNHTQYLTGNVGTYTYQEYNHGSLIDSYYYALASILGNDRTQFVDTDKTNLQKTLRMVIGGIKTNKEFTKIVIHYKTSGIFSSEKKLEIYPNEDGGGISTLEAVNFALPLLLNRSSINNYYVDLYVADVGTGANQTYETIKLTKVQFDLLYDYLPDDITDNISLTGVSKLPFTLLNKERTLSLSLNINSLDYRYSNNKTMIYVIK